MKSNLLGFSKYASFLMENAKSSFANHSYHFGD